MIVRIASEGQYRVESSALDRLNEMDNRIVELVGKGDEAGFASSLQELLAFVRERGKSLEAHELVESDVILPPPDITLEEARQLFHGEGLVPG